SGRLLRRPRQHNAAATVAEYCSADYTHSLDWQLGQQLGWQTRLANWDVLLGEKPQEVARHPQELWLGRDQSR
uniref:hypothetical protein n=1 Tax=Pseudophaeobacter arcticus TaxID=385492 RepID=UPI00249225B5